MEKCKFPCRRDYWYIVCILGIIIAILTIQLIFNDGAFSTKLELASTLISIVLAVVAIVITLTEGSKNAIANEEILRSSKSIKDSTFELNNATNELNKVYSLVEEIQSIKLIVSEMKDISVTKDEFNNFYQVYTSNKRTENDESSATNEMTIDKGAVFNDIYESSNPDTRQVIEIIFYTLIGCIEKSLKVTQMKIVNAIAEYIVKEGKASLAFLKGLCMGYTNVFSNLGFFAVRRDTNWIYIESIDKDILENFIQKNDIESESSKAVEEILASLTIE